MGLDPRLAPERRTTPHVLGVALALAALLLRLWHLGAQPLWFDEAMTVHIALQPNGLEFVHNTPPLYYLALRAWTAVFGADAAGLRSLSAVAGAGFVWVCWHATREALGTRVGLAAAAFVALSPLHVYYSQEARAYSLLLLELAIALWMLRRLAANARPSHAIAFVATSTAALYTHYLAAIPLAVACVAHAAAAGQVERRRGAAAIAATSAVIALLVVPWVWWWSRRTPFEASDMQWLTTVWSELPGASAFTTSTELLLLGGQDTSLIFLKQFSTMSFPFAARVGGLAAAALLALLLLARLRDATPPARRTAARAFAMFAAPLAVLWLLSFAHAMYCPGRYDLVGFPGLTALVGIAIGGIPDARTRWQRWSAGAAAVVFAAVLVAKDWCYFAAPADADPPRAVAALLANKVQPGETAVLCGETGAPVLAHLLLDGFVWIDHRCRSTHGDAAFECRLLPTSLEVAPGSVSRYWRTLEDGSLPAELAHLLAGDPAPGIWIVLGSQLYANDEDEPNRAIRHRMFQILADAGYTTVDSELSLGVVHLRRAPR
jgi:4-amino-4-deoxy-L-arabinose transferase-like glycosyltransferase